MLIPVLYKEMLRIDFALFIFTTTFKIDKVKFTFGKAATKETKRILIVEDEPMSVRVLEQILKPYQFKLIVAVNGLDAVEKFKKAPVDLVIMDLYMPEMDGFEASKLIKATSPDTPIIVFSTTDIDEETLKKDIGIDYLLKKPLNIKKFQDFIHMLLLA